MELGEVEHPDLFALGVDVESEGLPFEVIGVAVWGFQ